VYQATNSATPFNRLPEADYIAKTNCIKREDSRFGYFALFSGNFNQEAQLFFILEEHSSIDRGLKPFHRYF